MSRPRVAWTLCFVAIAAMAFQVSVRVGPNASVSAEASDWLFVVFFLLCAVLGALLVSKRPENTVGWLLLIIGVANTVLDLAQGYVESFANAPVDPPVFLVLALWVASLSWITLIFPLFHLLLVFPTGRLLSNRWRWVVILEWALIAFIVGVVVLLKQIGVEDGWTVENPIGVLTVDPFELPIVSSLWNAGLAVLPLAGAISMVVRFRRSQVGQRQQIKLLLFVFVAFALVFSLSVISPEGGEGWLGVLFAVSLLLIPITIAFAILRKGLFDIDLIVRRTVIYALLTGVLTLVYLGSIFLTQNLFGLRERASWQVAGSTLLVTALFSPLRRRVQRVIDRRLFRRRYDAQLMVERFAGSAQNQSDLDLLSADFVGVVHQTIQPSQAKLWIRAGS